MGLHGLLQGYIYFFKDAAREGARNFGYKGRLNRSRQFLLIAMEYTD
jgi:hypothetical protein